MSDWQGYAPLPENQEKRTTRLSVAAMNAVDAQLREMGCSRPSRAATTKVEDGSLRVVVILDEELRPELGA